jgi:outer membrane protein assembly factor BamB
LNANDGTKVWQTALIDEPAGFMRAPDGAYDLYLALDGTRLYAVSSKEDKGQVMALDARTGHILWTYTEDADPVYLLLATNGMCYIKVGPKPATVGGESVKALDEQSGKLLWSVSSGEDRFGQFTASSKAAYIVQHKIVPSDPKSRGLFNVVDLHALRLSDGVELWHQEVENTNGQTVISAGDVNVQADDQTVYLFKTEDQIETTPTGLTSTILRTLVALRAQDGTPLWSVKDPQSDPPHISAGTILYLIDQALYMVGGYHAIVFSAQDGHVLSAFQSPSYHLWLFAPKNHLYALNRAGQVCSLNSSTGTQRWCSAFLVQPTDSAVAAVGTDNIYLFGYQLSQPQEKAVYMLKQNDGSQMSRYLLLDFIVAVSGELWQE